MMRGMIVSVALLAVCVWRNLYLKLTLITRSGQP
jgi:hypothetical protein